MAPSGTPSSHFASSSHDSGPAYGIPPEATWLPSTLLNESALGIPSRQLEAQSQSYCAVIKLYERTPNELTVYLGSWHIIEDGSRRIHWQCGNAGDYLEHYLPSESPLDAVPYTLHARHRPYGKPEELELNITFRETHRLVYRTRERQVHEVTNVSYEFTTTELSIQFQGDVRRKDLIDWFDMDVVWSNVHRRTDSDGLVCGLGTIQRLKLWRDRSSLLHSITCYANRQHHWEEYMVICFHSEPQQMDRRHRRLHLKARSASGVGRPNALDPLLRVSLSTTPLIRSRPSSNSNSPSSATYSQPSISPDIRYIALQFSSDDDLRRFEHRWSVAHNSDTDIRLLAIPNAARSSLAKAGDSGTGIASPDNVSGDPSLIVHSSELDRGGTSPNDNTMSSSNVEHSISELLALDRRDMLPDDNSLSGPSSVQQLDDASNFTSCAEPTPLHLQEQPEEHEEESPLLPDALINEDNGKGTPSSDESNHSNGDPVRERTSWRAVLWHTLVDILDPPGRGTQRIRYPCGCGDLIYFDVEEVDPGGVDELRQILLAKSRSIREHSYGQDGVNHPVSLPQAHLSSPVDASNQGQPGPIQRLPTMNTSTPRNDSMSSETQRLSTVDTSVERKYLLLCVNTKLGLTKVTHLDVSSTANDQYLFQDIYSEYSRMRRDHEWNLAVLFPTRLRVPRWLYNLVDLSPLRYIKLPSWLVGSLDDYRIFIPKKVEFVQFQLMPVRTEICAGNMVKPEIPGEEEVFVKKTYEYRPVPLKVKIVSIPFFHELLKPGAHLGRFWWNIFPKKLDGLLLWDENSECIGWGIHITEGWNTRLVVSLVFILMILFGVFVLTYSLVTQDGSTGAGIGSFMMSFLALYCWLRYEEWRIE